VTTGDTTGETPTAVPDARDRLDGVAPGLYGTLAAIPTERHEADAGAAFAALKATRASTLLVPAACGGLGASVVDAVRFQLALASLAPSAAIATTMHHYKIGALGRVAASGDERAAAILTGIAAGAGLVASGGAESTPGHDLRSLGSWATPDPEAPDGPQGPGGYRVSGLKRPCSLSRSMDVMSLMVELRDPDGTRTGYAQAFVDAGAEGLSREPFWQSPVFLAAESHAVRLDEVRVPAERVFPLHGETGRSFAVDCYTYFQLLVSAAYLGVASCLASYTAPVRRAASRLWTDALADLRALEDGLLDAARALDAGARDAERLNLAVDARDRVEDAAGVLGSRLLRAAGGGTFARSALPTTLAGALNAIAFHPPQRGAREGVGLELLDPKAKERD
jgi:alkylation response protein AidB-like acyl-CoA dehydrogenase